MTAIAASGLRAYGIAGPAGQQRGQRLHRRLQADREFYSLISRPAGGGDPNSTMPVIQRSWTDLARARCTPPAIRSVALSGKGILHGRRASGPLYTRNGSFRLAADGNSAPPMATPCAMQGAPISLQSTGISRLARRHGAAGRQRNRPTASCGRNTGCQKGCQLFPDHGPGSQACSAIGHRGRTRQPGSSNTGTAESAVRLISVMRQFEMLQKAVTLGAEMNRRAVEEVAKV